LRPDGRRKLLVAGGFAYPSDDGGIDELREFCPNLALNSAISASCSTIRALNSTTSATNSSTDNPPAPKDT
jgi:hypothetical protein